MMRRIAVVDAPSNLGLRPPTATSVPGCAKAPGALRDQDLIGRLGARDAGCLTPPRYDPGDWRPGDGVSHAEQIGAYSMALAERIGAIMDEGEFPVVLGGDCSILLGAALAMHRLGEAVGGRIGLVYVDGHSDFRHPGNASYVGAAAGEGLALVTGRGQADLAAIEGRRPYFRDIDVVVLGIRAQDEYRLDLQAAGIVTRPAPPLRAEGAARSAQWAHDQLADCAGYWVHVDIDVLDPAVMPAVDAPDAGGIAFPELELLLAGLVDTPHCLGVEITVFDPDYDPDGYYAAEIVDMLAAGLAPVSAPIPPALPAQPAPLPAQPAPLPAQPAPLPAPPPALLAQPLPPAHLLAQPAPSAAAVPSTVPGSVPASEQSPTSRSDRDAVAVPPLTIPAERGLGRPRSSQSGAPTGDLQPSELAGRGENEREGGAPGSSQGSGEWPAIGQIHEGQAPVESTVQGRPPRGRRPEHGGSDGQRPEHGGSDGQRPEHGGSDSRWPEIAMPDFRRYRPDAHWEEAGPEQAHREDAYPEQAHRDEGHPEEAHRQEAHRQEAHRQEAHRQEAGRAEAQPTEPDGLTGRPADPVGPPSSAGPGRLRRSPPVPDEPTRSASDEADPPTRSDVWSA